jgi:adenosylhomocysteine nucleosidase
VIAIVIALGEEVRDFLASGEFSLAARQGPVAFHESPRYPHIFVVEGGAGRRQVDQATRAAIERYHPSFVVSAGFSGATKPGLKPGDLLISDQAWALVGPESTWERGSALQRRLLTDSERHQLASALGSSGLAPAFGGVATVDRLVSSTERKAWLGQALPVSVVDMESYWACEATAQRNVQCFAIRSVLDPLGQRLPRYVAQATEDAAQRSVWRAAVYALSHPGDVPALVSLGSQYRLAKASLASALGALAESDILTLRPATKAS